MYLAEYPDMYGVHTSEFLCQVLVDYKTLRIQWLAEVYSPWSNYLRLCGGNLVLLRST